MLGEALKIILPSGYVLEADTLVSADHSREIKASRFVVEDGGTITDHTILEPLTSELEAIVTLYPLRPVHPAGPDRVDNFWLALETAAEQRLVCQVFTGRRTYPAALILKLETSDNKDNIGQLRFKLRVQEYRTASAVSVSKRVARKAAHKPKAAQGTKFADKVKKAAAALNAGIAAEIFGGQ